MNFIAYYNKIVKALPELNFLRTYLQNTSPVVYQADNLDNLREAIEQIEDIPNIGEEIKQLKDSWLFGTFGDSQKINSAQSSLVESAVNLLRIKLNTLKEIAESSNALNNDNSILVRIPEIKSFDNLARYAADFKKAIEMPILDSNVNGAVEIIGADEGSIIFYVSLGSFAGVGLIAKICWAAAVIKKKNAEANMFLEHAKSLNLKNQALTDLLEAQRIQLKHILESEADAIANKEYSHKEPETLERLKLSITTFTDLLEKGVQVLPISKDESIRKEFPDYKNMNLIESAIKQSAPSS